MSNSNFKQINPSKTVSVKNQEKTEKRQSFRIEDDTDSIEVVFWGNKTQQCNTLSVGDVIVLNNVKISRYYKTVTLQSTRATNIKQVDSHCSLDPNAVSLSYSLLFSVCLQVNKVGIRKIKMEIVGIIEAQKSQTRLQVNLEQKVQTLTVPSKLLAEAFGLTLKENFKSQLVSALPMLAEAAIEGCKIKELTLVQS